MKFRIYLVTLLVFLVLLFGGIGAVSYMNFKSGLNQEKEIAAATHFQIIDSFSKDLTSLTNQGKNVDEVLPHLLNNYIEIAFKNKGSIMIFKNTNPVKSIGKPVLYPLTVFPENGSRIINIQKEGSVYYVVVTGNLQTPYEEYTIQYSSTMSDFISPWKQSRNALFGLGLLISIFVIIILMLLLHRTFLPLTKISSISQKIASGNYKIGSVPLRL